MINVFLPAQEFYYHYNILFIHCIFLPTFISRLLSSISVPISCKIMVIFSFIDSSHLSLVYSEENEYNVIVNIHQLHSDFFSVMTQFSYNFIEES
jgi:hypothetical protein